MTKWSVLAVVGLIGCANVPSVSPSEYCRQDFRIRCSARACCSVPSIRQADCTAAELDSYDTSVCPMFDEALSSRLYRWDGVAAAEILDRQREAARTCGVAGFAGIMGSGAGGALGHIGDDCRTGLSQLAGGLGCADPNSYCDYAGSGRCTLIPGLGGTCDPAAFGPCSTGLFCSAAGRCEQLLAEGAVCDPIALLPGCDGVELFCSQTGRCTRRAADGAVCTSGGECASGSCPAGTCAARLPNGSRCDDTSGVFCTGRCIAGICQTLSTADMQVCG